jgi:putative ABC transport system permease protein
MKTPLALLNLLQDKVRTGVAVAGVTFAVVLIFMQLGFLEAVRTSATIIYDVLDFDICVRSTDYLYLSDSRSFVRDRLYQAESVAGVEKVMPFNLGLFMWRQPPRGVQRTILTMGVRRNDELFLDGDVQRAVHERLDAPEAILIDTETRHEYGPRNGKRFGIEDLNVTPEINGRKVFIAGHFSRGAGLSASGAVLVNERGFLRLVAPNDRERVSLGLVKLSAHAQCEDVVKRLTEKLPNDVEIMSRAEVLRLENNRWVWQTNYGLIFVTGVIVAFVVGIAIVYQVLSSDVSRLLPEYATLKAMGYRNGYLASVVLQQALVLALLAFVSGLSISLILYLITTLVTGIPIRMTLENLSLVFAMTILMCAVSGIAAIRKAFQAEPADLF